MLFLLAIALLAASVLVGTGSLSTYLVVGAVGSTTLGLMLEGMKKKR